MDDTFGVEFSFREANSVVSAFSVSGEKSLKNYGELIRDNKRHIATVAQRMQQLGPNGNILQGVVVVTSVIYANSGVNLIAKTKGSKFRLTAKSPGVVECFLGFDPGEGSYESSDSEGTILRNIWPSTGGGAGQPIPIAYEVASFVDGELIPMWNRTLTPFTVKVDTEGVMSTDFLLSYEMPIGTNHKGGKLKDQGFKGLQNFNPIPVGAKNVNLRIVSYKAGGRQENARFWSNPQVDWTTNTKQVIVKAPTAFSKIRIRQSDV